MKQITLVILSCCLFCCKSKSPKEQSDKDQAQPDTLHFRIENINVNQIRLGWSDGQFIFNHNIKGTITNLSISTLNDYEIQLNYQSFDKVGNSYLLNDSLAGYVGEDGFGGNSFYHPVSPPWKPQEVKTFKIENTIFKKDIIYPTSKMILLIAVKASDPFGKSYWEVVGDLDVTDQWLKAQREYSIKSNHVTQPKKEDVVEDEIPN